jgi:VWFA-related protein
MKLSIVLITLAAIALTAALPASAQQPAPASQAPVVKSTVDEVVLDFVARDKKGKPVTDLKQEDLTVSDNGAKEQPTSFRLVQGAEAISQSGATTKLDPLRQLRLVTLAFEAMSDPTQRKTARSGAVDLVKGEQGGNVFYSVVVIDTRLLVLQPFTSDKDALIKAIDDATSGYAVTKLLPESEKIKSDLQRSQSGQTTNQPAAGGAGVGDAAVQAKLVSVMLDMLRMDAAMASQDARLSLNALESLVRGLQSMPGRKSVLYFTGGMYLTPELDAIFRNLTSMANRANVTFYTVDTRGVMTYAQNAGATDQLNRANMAAGKDTLSEGATGQERRIMPRLRRGPMYSFPCATWRKPPAAFCWVRATTCARRCAT